MLCQSVSLKEKTLNYLASFYPTTLPACLNETDFLTRICPDSMTAREVIVADSTLLEKAYVILQKSYLNHLACLYSTFYELRYEDFLGAVIAIHENVSQVLFEKYNYDFEDFYKKIKPSVHRALYIQKEEGKLSKISLRDKHPAFICAVYDIAGVPFDALTPVQIYLGFKFLESQAPNAPRSFFVKYVSGLWRKPADCLLQCFLPKEQKEFLAKTLRLTKE